MAFSFSVSLLVQNHSNGSVTAEVLGESDLVVWGLQLDDLREDLELALTDRIERSHPSLLSRFAAPRGRERIPVVVDDVLKLLAEEPELRACELDVVVEPEGQWRRLWIPKLDARLWLSEEQDLEEEVAGFVEKALKGSSIEWRLALRPEGKMELVLLELEVDPAPLVAFTGANDGLMRLPEPIPESERKAEQEERKKVPTPGLDRIAIESTAEPDLLAKAYGRETEVADLLRMLERPGAAVVLVGPPTCGKSVVIDEVVRRLAELDKRAWFVDASRLVTADVFTGWRQQTLGALQELGEAEGIWLCGNPIDLLDAGKHVGSEMNVAQLLKPFLSGGQLRVLGECSESTWGRLEAKDAGFARLFTPYRMTEPAPAASRAVLDALAPQFAVPVTPDGLDAAIELSRRYGPADALLGTTCHFLRRTVAEARSRGVEGPLARLEILRRFCAETGLPEILLRDELSLDPEVVRAAFRARLVGQDEALGQMVDLIAVIKSGMSDLGRPLGSFLFVGPTGVGKTETAKALASWLFGREERLVRFDMSEYSGPDCLQRLLDPEAGLVARVRQTPFCVVLLDEIEKAHAAVFDLLLQVLGEARLSDGTGRTADFRNAVVLMTSNLGVGSFRRPTGFGTDVATALQDHVRGEVERFFRPELFNRIDRVVPFASLGPDAILGIAEREVAAVARREGLSGRGVHLDLAPEVVGFLAERGVDLQFGARPLKRAVQSHLVAPLARHLSRGGTPPRIRVEVAGAQLSFKNAEADGRIASHDKLRRLLGDLSELRFRAECWLQSEPCRKAKHELRLVDRLMNGKRFWKDHGAAVARSRATEPLREAVTALTEARDQVLAVEELAHEAWIARDSAMLSTLSAQTEEVDTALADAELRLMGMKFADPNIAWLHLEPADDALEFSRRLLVGYVALGARREWEMEILTGSGKKLKWPTEKISLDALLHRLGKLIPAPFRLRFSGEHAAALLSSETGAHVLKDGLGSKRVQVRFSQTPPGKSAKSDKPDQPDKSLPSVRLFDTRKSHVRHPVHKVQTTLHAQWDGAILEMMRYGLYTRALGRSQGQILWRGTSWR